MDITRKEMLENALGASTLEFEPTMVSFLHTNGVLNVAGGELGKPEQGKQCQCLEHSVAACSQPPLSVRSWCAPKVWGHAGSSASEAP